MWRLRWRPIDFLIFAVICGVGLAVVCLGLIGRIAHGIARWVLW